MAATVPGCFACHVDCAAGCATDDQPFDHPDYADYNIPSFDETDADEAEARLREQSSESNMSGKGVQKNAHGPEEASPLMRFVLWALNVKTDTGA